MGQCERSRGESTGAVTRRSPAQPWAEWLGATHSRQAGVTLLKASAPGSRWIPASGAEPEGGGSGGASGVRGTRVDPHRARKGET